MVKQALYPCSCCMKLNACHGQAGSMQQNTYRRASCAVVVVVLRAAAGSSGSALVYSIKRYGQTSPMRCVTPRSAPAPKFSGNFWTPASKPLWPTRDPKFPGNFGAWAVCPLKGWASSTAASRIRSPKFLENFWFRVARSLGP